MIPLDQLVRNLVLRMVLLSDIVLVVCWVGHKNLKRLQSVVHKIHPPQSLRMSETVLQDLHCMRVGVMLECWRELLQPNHNRALRKAVGEQLVDPRNQEE